MMHLVTMKKKQKKYSDFPSIKEMLFFKLNLIFITSKSYNNVQLTFKIFGIRFTAHAHGYKCHK
jgi:hypothetical protein